MTSAPRWFLLAALLAPVAGCGGGSGSGAMGPQLPNGSMSAVIDGQAWSATLSVLAKRAAGNIVSVGGSDANATSMAFAFNDSGPHVYQIGGLSSTNALILSGAKGWSAAALIGSGEVTITTLTAVEVAGTFDFIAPAAQAGTTPAVSHITNGQFDVKF